MESKKQTRDWTPVRNGQTYCSPACGGRCKHSDYLKAVKLADALVKKCKKEIGGEWKPRVHENLGWHWSVVQDGTNIEIDFGGYLAKGDYYSVGLSGGTPIQVSTRDNFKTPAEAYKAQVKLIKNEFTRWNKLYKNVTK